MIGIQLAIWAFIYLVCILAGELLALAFGLGVLSGVEIGSAIWLTIGITKFSFDYDRSPT